ncbi:MAG: 3-hydroxy-3-methylglutaryl-CoA reductase, partial [Anaerolineales bacterium]
LAALRALATEGIQKGHMTLHARQVAIAAGAEGTQIPEVAQAMVNLDAIGVETAQTLLQKPHKPGDAHSV